ncbi:terminase small subunit [Shouchella clausii]|uniref:terminase small subunit n=1 Tax=Shouchella TaxID=2893057 RepID=UPI0004E79382|nr:MULTISPECIES: terminase small subunit [Shouchella]ALA55049.1 Phage terminase small subunit [Shouchella clausii]MBU3231022.1 terminase small subunit [Shouchella clausii]MBU3262903.1 terminase small subunit [Shouchella clausii]MBU3505367.1 terminase small subunit [Shouchella clausii]MBU3534933.1 terminase small subunit [Shouchella clausii]
MNWEDIRKEYETTSITLKALAEKHGVKLGTLKSRKSREGWSRDATKQKDASKVATPKKDATETIKEEKKVFVEAEGLTDKQRLFCIYYIKSFNATMAAIKAGYSPDTAHVQGSRLLKNVKVAEEIRKLKNEMQQGIFLDAMDVLNKYIQIAFADITDYAIFGKKEIEVMGPFGPIKDADGNLLTKDVNYVDFKESDMVDGTIVTEVKQGKDGISIKLADKMKALEKLELYFDLLPDKHKRRMEEEKLKLAQLKANSTEQGKQESEVAAMLRAMVNKDGT